MHKLASRAKTSDERRQAPDAVDAGGIDKEGNEADTSLVKAQ